MVKTPVVFLVLVLVGSVWGQCPHRTGRNGFRMFEADQHCMINRRYSPLCASDGCTYVNEDALKCANKLRSATEAEITLVWHDVCPKTVDGNGASKSSLSENEDISSENSNSIPVSVPINAKDDGNQDNRKDDMMKDEKMMDHKDDNDHGNEMDDEDNDVKRDDDNDSKRDDDDDRKRNDVNEKDNDDGTKRDEDEDNEEEDSDGEHLYP